MGNEPTFEVPGLTSRTAGGTQRVVQQILASAFGTGPDGLLPTTRPRRRVSGWCGVRWAYPQIPGVAGGAIGSPQFPQIDVRLGNGRTLADSWEAARPRPTRAVAVDQRSRPRCAMGRLRRHRERRDAALRNGQHAVAMGQPEAAAVVRRSGGGQRGRQLQQSRLQRGRRDNADGGRGLRRQPVQHSLNALAAAGVQPGKPFGRRERRGGGRAVLARQHRDRRQTVMLPPGSAGTGVVVRLGQQWPEQRHGAAEFADGSTVASRWYRFGQRQDNKLIRRGRW